MIIEVQEYIKKLWDKYEGTDLEKATQIHDYIGNKTPDEINSEVGGDYVAAYVWRDAEQLAYNLMYGCLMKQIRGEQI